MHITDFKFLEEIKLFHAKKASLRFRELQYQAQRLMAMAIAKGILIRPLQCEHCGRGGIIHGHHYDYNRPLQVQWLCHACHRMVHGLNWRDKRTQIFNNKLKVLYPASKPQNFAELTLYFVEYPRF